MWDQNIRALDRLRGLGQMGRKQEITEILERDEED